MTPDQRFFFDLTGYLHLTNVLENDELEQAQEAADRYINMPPAELPSGFGADLEREDLTTYKHGFAFDEALKNLIIHPKTWPIVLALTNDRPRFTGGTLMRNTYGQTFHPLHSAREGPGYHRELPFYYCKDGRIHCSDLVIFVYLTDVFPGDGGLMFVTGSHKSNFVGSEEFFFERRSDYEGYDPGVPPGVVNVTPRAGDVVITSEMVSHGALVWKRQDRERRFLTLRYAQQHTAFGSWGSFPEEIKARLSADLLELTQPAGYVQIKELVKRDKEVPH